MGKCGKYCSVVNCNNNQSTIGIDLFRFPRLNLEQRDLWIQALHRKYEDGSPWQPRDGSVICSAHFLNGIKSVTRGHPSYVPSIFPTLKKIAEPDLEKKPTASGRYCCVVNCHNNQKTRGVKMFSFPRRNLEQRDLWIKAVNRINPDGSVWMPNNAALICSDHFWDNIKSPTRKHPSYVPTIFPTTADAEKKALQLKKERRKRKKKEKEVLMQNLAGLNVNNRAKTEVNLDSVQPRPSSTSTSMPITTVTKKRQLTSSGCEGEKSKRNRRKAVTKKNYNDGKPKGGKAALYDEKGVLIDSQKDLCDCTEEDCPGCHFPCQKCRSNKCGHECRQNRKWMVECVELDGVPGTLKHNPNLVQTSTNAGRYGDSSRFFGMLWRYATMADPLVSEVHFRDLDSTISGREVSAVSDWRDKSDAAFHIMRDHPEHETTILGGGFGVRKPLGEDNAKGPFALLLKDLYEKMMMASRAMWVAELDQILLETVVWPFAQKNMVAHDSYCCTEMDLVSDYNRAWPTQRINGANYSSVGEPNFFGSNGGEITLSEQGPCPLQCRPVDHQDWLLC